MVQEATSIALRIGHTLRYRAELRPGVSVLIKTFQIYVMSDTVIRLQGMPRGAWIMFRLTLAILLLLTVASGLLAFGAVHVPAASIAKALFGCFLFLLVVELVLGRRSI
jgi:uncharacterized membrane protein YtjA (UPF0391 family)